MLSLADGMLETELVILDDAVYESVAFNDAEKLEVSLFVSENTSGVGVIDDVWDRELDCVSVGSHDVVSESVNDGEKVSVADRCWVALYDLDGVCDGVKENDLSSEIVVV